MGIDGRGERVGRGEGLEEKTDHAADLVVHEGVPSDCYAQGQGGGGVGVGGGEHGSCGFGDVELWDGYGIYGYFAYCSVAPVLPG